MPLLAEQLRAMRIAAAPRLVVGFTSQIRYYMQLSDFFVGKPGPGSISEAVQQGLPVIVVRNAWTMPQERYNTEWVEENGAGVVLDSFKAIRGGVAQVADRHRGVSRASVAAHPQSRGVRNSGNPGANSSGAGSGRRRSRQAFPGRRAPASVLESSRAAAARKPTARGG